MKRLIILIIGITIKITSFAQVTFREDLSWGQLKETAKAERKYILLDVMATWCGPCKAMEHEVYPDTALGKFLNQKFIAVKVQTDKAKNDNEFIKSWYTTSQEIMSLYQITGLPSLIFLSPDGKFLYKSVGFRSKEELIVDAKKAMNPAGRYDLLLESYFKGQSDKKFITELINKTDSMGRHIMAQKIAYETQSTVKDSTAYAVLSKLTGKQPGQLKEDFTGDWMVDYPASEFGDRPLRVAAKEIQVKQSVRGLEITRTSTQLNAPDLITSEYLFLSGKSSSSNTATEKRKKVSRLLPDAAGRSFTEFSEVTFPDGDKSIDYVITENWEIQTDNTLQVMKTVHTNTGPYSVKLIYRK